MKVESTVIKWLCMVGVKYISSKKKKKLLMGGGRGNNSLYTGF